MKKRLFTLLLFMALSKITMSQTCNYLAYDGFSYASNTHLQGLQGGTGWAEPWQVQNADVTIPGYQTASGSPLNWLNLQTAGVYAGGGQAYLTSGRRFNLQSTGPFAPWLNSEGAIGASGTTLWMSVLLRKIANNDQPVWAMLHGSNLQWCTDCSPDKIGMGYFGSNSNVSGQRRWTLRLGDNYYPTSVPVVPNEAVFVALKLEFQAGGTVVSIYVNPATIGNTAPAPTLTQTSATPIQIRSFGLYLGDTPNNDHADEVRMGNSYACVAPDPTVAVNQPPNASFTASPTSGTAPLAVTLDATASSDPDGTIASYLWDFGDGTPDGSGAVVTHTFNATGILTVQLTVADQSGLQHTFQRNITVLNQNGSFTCQLGLTAEQMATCTANTGRFRVSNFNNATLQLKNSAGTTIAPSSGNANLYHNLAPGAYTLTAVGTSGCRDTFPLSIQRDSSTCAGWTPNPCAMKIGVGIEGLAYYTPSRPFKDFFKSCGTWITYDPNPPGGNFTWNTGNQQHIPADANGYATVVPFTVPNGSGQNNMRGILSAGGFLPVGVPLRLLYDGVGTLQMQGNVTVTNNQPGQIDFTANNADNIFFNLTASQSGNHVRNIRVIETANAGDYLTQPFRQGFLDKCAPFHTLRFMDWARTNGSDQVQWANRTLPGYYSQAESPNGGAAYEYIIQLANLLDKNIWVCIPHQSDDNYITQMATMFRDQLDPGLTVYIEYSNETWNWIFEQAHWVADNGPQNISYPRRYVERATHGFDIWMQVWGAQNSRLKRVLGTQNGYDWVTEEILAHADPDKYDYISPSWYVGLDHGSTGVPNLQALGAAATTADVLANANHVFETFYPHWQMVYRTAKLYNKGVVNYEGGQHFTDFSVPPYIQAMYDAQVLPGMYDLYDRMLDSLRRLGSELPMAFVLTGPWQSIYGSWGHIFDEDDPAPFTDRPKYQVLLDQIGLCLTALPAELTDWTLQCKSDGLHLMWHSEVERDLEHFNVQMSPDGRAWTTVQQVRAKGRGTYREVMPVEMSGLYYRLESVDQSGQTEYSPILTNQCLTDRTVKIYPNPTTGLLHVDTPDDWAGETWHVRVTDALGQVLMTRWLSSDGTLILDAQFPVGLYQVEVSSDAGYPATTQRVVKW
jgi:PKD repeat protein